MIELGEKPVTEPARLAAVIATHENRREADLAGADWRTIDDIYTAAALHGGGMACAGLIGAWEYLQYRGLDKYFNGIAALSGGAGIMAAILDDKVADARHMFTRTLAGSDFINKARPILQRKPPVDLGLLHGKLEEILDIDAIYANPIDWAFGTTVLDPFSAEMHTKDDLPQARFVSKMIDGMRMPRLSGKVTTEYVVTEGQVVKRKIADGGLRWPSTEMLAKQMADVYANGREIEILGISCQPDSEPSVYEDFVRSTARWAHRAAESNIKKAVWDHAFAQRDHLQELRSGELEGAKVDVLYLQNVPNLARVDTTNQDVLDRTVIAGWNGACEAVGDEEHILSYPDSDERSTLAQRILAPMGGFALRQAIRFVP